MLRRLLTRFRAPLDGRVSLRARITAAFTLVVVGGTAISTLIGSRIITGALIEEAQRRATHGLDAARLVYADSLETTSEAVALAASDTPITTDQAASAESASKRTPAESLDFFTVLPGKGTDPSDPCLQSPSLRSMVAAALAGRRAAGVEVLSASCLEARNPALPARARTRVVHATVDAGPAQPEDVTSGLVLVAATPVLTARGRVAGAAYGGVLLNGRSEIVDRIRSLVYGTDLYEGRPLGTASILLGDTRVAANVTTASGERAIGTRASPEAARAVLRDGRRWRGRAFVLNDWYVAAYEPLRDYSGHVVGMLYVGILEAPILAVRTNVMLTFLVVCVLGLAVVFALTYVITRRTISPLEEIVAATRRIAAGDLSTRVSVVSRDEIGDLARSFNDMVSSLQTTKRQLEEWGRTLEERVKERTDQLVAVQAQMARSEKLASIGRLAAGVAHSINNPLGGILSLSMLAQETCTDAALTRDLDTISRQALRCREIVKGLLEFSHQADARVVRTEVNAIVDGAVSLLQRQAVFHNVTIERRFDPDVLPVLVDPGQLQEVVTNLVVNSVDAMDAGGALTIETAIGRAADRSGNLRPDVIIRVADTGRGIPAEVMPFLFEPFFTTKPVGKGTGLGLAIAHGVVTRAGGRIEVNSSPCGTTFTIHLPAAPVDEEDGAVEMSRRDARKSAAPV